MEPIKYTKEIQGRKQIVYTFEYKNFKYDMPEEEYFKYQQDGKTNAILIDGKLEMISDSDLKLVEQTLAELKRLGLDKMPKVIKNKK